MFIILKTIGEYSPKMLFIFSVFLLRNKTNLLFYYLLFFGIRKRVSLVLKKFFNQPRPSMDLKTFQLMIQNKERYVNKHGGLPCNVYGMPSGHSQSVVFSTVFIYYCLRDYNVVLVYTEISLKKLFQRVIHDDHTVMQVIVGSLTGYILGYVGYIVYHIIFLVHHLDIDNLYCIRPFLFAIVCAIFKTH
jgi:membrane-associated phospholipid phosphatase